MDLATITLAISLSAHGMSWRSAETYAKVIERQSEILQQDPLTTIAIIKHESRWNPFVVSEDRKDYGLMGIRAKYSKKTPEQLLNGWSNIETGTYFEKSAYDFCEKHLGRPPARQEWLNCYQTGCGKIKTRCKPTPLTNRIESYAECLRYTIETQTCSYDCDAIYTTYPKR